MAYEKQTWVTGEVITKEKLNHMEDGIANGGSGIFLFSFTDVQTMTLNKTWNEMKSALESNLLPIGFANTAVDTRMVAIVTGVANEEEGVYIVLVNGDTRTIVLSTDNPDGYPANHNN